MDVVDEETCSTKLTGISLVTVTRPCTVSADSKEVAASVAPAVVTR